MMGEFPPLPPQLIRELRGYSQYARHRAADALWDKIAEKSVEIFEGYRAGMARGTF